MAQLVQSEQHRMVVFTFDEFSKAFNGRQNEVPVLREFPKLVNLERLNGFTPV